ncbi:phage tailspike protein [Escherichia coli]|uniref:phage tailspike protein n=1 Tax=Escherichia coli TaxID=562 RepID=UPI0028544857|nr:hypothetical protein [Escherichia coli]HDW2927225.1 hypothetical protein [Escherichia coli]
MTNITPNVVIGMPSQLFTMARSFKAVANGKIYIGKIDTDPVNPENQIPVYVENEDGSHVPVSQPIIINAAGYPVYNGQIAKFVTVKGHSMAVYDAYGAQQFYFPNVLKYDPDQFSIWAKNHFELSKYVRLDPQSFQTGAILTDKNQVLYDSESGRYYQWGGELNKSVPENSTPSSTGGVSNTAWIDVGDSTYAYFLSGKFGAQHIGYGNRKVSDILPLYTSDWDINNNNTPQQNAENLNRLIEFAIANDRIYIHVDNDANIDDVSVPVRKKTEVFFINDGGNLYGLYRRSVVQKNAPDNKRISDGSVISGMTTFYKASELCNVVIMGDSISTEGPNALSKNDCMASVIFNEIKKTNPDVNFNFINRAIGGQTWLHANSKPTGFPAWYTDTSKDWLEYVKSDSPDLLILAFGMNDANGFNAGALHSVVNKINAWEKVPSLIFVTNPVPAISTTWSGGQGFYATIFQEGRDWAAGYARSYARHYGYSLLDINRQFCLIRDGRDYIDIPLKRVGTYNQSYVHDTNVIARDFAITGDISSWPEGKVLSVKVGQGSLDIVFITNNGGHFKVTAYCEGDYSSPYVDVATSIPVALGQTLDISVQNDTFAMFIGITQVISFSLIRTGGEIALVAEWQDSPGSGPFVSVAANVGNFLECKYTARDSDIWGHDDGTAETKYPEGGNGINHYSSNGIDLIVKPVVSAFNFRRIPANIKVEINNFSDGVSPLTKVFATLKGSSVSLSGRVSVNNSSPIELFILPIDIIPSSQRILTAPALGTSWGQGVISVDATGHVYLSSGDATSMLSLDGLAFEL